MQALVFVRGNKETTLFAGFQAPVMQSSNHMLGNTRKRQNSNNTMQSATFTGWSQQYSQEAIFKQAV